LSLSELSLKKIDLAVDLFPKGSEVRVDLVELVETEFMEVASG